MPIPSPELLNHIRELTQELLRIYVDSWEARVEFDGPSDSIQINVRGERGYIFHGIVRVELEHNAPAVIQYALRNIERQVQDWLRANPAPLPRQRYTGPFYDDAVRGAIERPPVTMQTLLEAFDTTAVDGDTIRLIRLGGRWDVSEFRENKIAPAAKSSGIPAPERKSCWQRLLGDFLV